MTWEPRALFDVDAIRQLSTLTIGVMSVQRATVVLGSRQRIDALDEAVLHRDGVDLRRRRGGGGAVLLRPEDCWVELWLPSSAREMDPDVRATAYAVGEWWRSALAAVGLCADMHSGDIEHPDEAAVACFAGLGPGELSVGGRKLLGLSQWRAREGVLASCVVPFRPPADLTKYLSALAAPTPTLRTATSLGEAAPTRTATELVTSFTRTVAAVHPGTGAPTATFA